MTNASVLERASVVSPVRRERTEPSGLCTTCDHRDDCVYAGIDIQPVVFCEEFRADATAEMASLDNAGIPSDPALQVEVRLQGLCVNCDNRKDCVHEKPDGPINYCEEYA
jgi:hypothetical protein